MQEVEKYCFKMNRIDRKQLQIRAKYEKVLWRSRNKKPVDFAS